MSKSLGNHIPLQASAGEMFGQLMSLPDEAMRTYFDLLTRLPPPQVEELLAGHPMAAKTRLAREITARFHTGEAADAAARAFERVFSRGGEPDAMPMPPARARGDRGGCPRPHRGCRARRAKPGAW